MSDRLELRYTHIHTKWCPSMPHAAAPGMKVQPEHWHVYAERSSHNLAAIAAIYAVVAMYKQSFT